METLQEDLWVMQEKLRQVLASTSTYEVACDYLGLDPSNPVLKDEAVNVAAGQLTPKAWQVTGSATSY